MAESAPVYSSKRDEASCTARRGGSGAVGLREDKIAKSVVQQRWVPRPLKRHRLAYGTLGRRGGLVPASCSHRPDVILTPL